MHEKPESEKTTQQAEVDRILELVKKQNDY